MCAESGERLEIEVGMRLRMLDIDGGNGHGEAVSQARAGERDIQESAVAVAGDGDRNPVTDRIQQRDDARERFDSQMQLFLDSVPLPGRPKYSAIAAAESEIDLPITIRFCTGPNANPCSAKIAVSPTVHAGSVSTSNPSQSNTMALTRSGNGRDPVITRG
jgi:hypothetical protein